MSFFFFFVGFFFGITISKIVGFGFQFNIISSGQTSSSFRVVVVLFIIIIIIVLSSSSCKRKSFFFNQQHGSLSSPFIINVLLKMK